MTAVTYTPVERLDLETQARLVEIAHETTSHEIRVAALRVLDQYLNPLMVASVIENTKIDR